MTSSIHYQDTVSKSWPGPVGHGHGQGLATALGVHIRHIMHNNANVYNLPSTNILSTQNITLY